MRIEELLPATTGIGSVPHTDIDEALDMVLASVEIPFWTQHPKLSRFELMIPQFTEFLPYTVVEEDGRSVFCRRPESDSYAALQRFYELMLSDDFIETVGVVSEHCAAGLYALLDRLREDDRRLPCLKLHTTGPLTFTLGLNFDDRTPIYSDPQLREVALMLLEAKSLWQVQTFKPFAESLILFLDEPILSAVGTYLQLKDDVVVKTLNSLIEGMKKKSPELMVGVHCCGNTDWSLLVKSGADIISFDAYFYGETLLLYADALRSFIEDGGLLAFGIVPTDGERTLKETPENLVGRLQTLIGRLSAKGVNVAYERILLTPSCGVGSLSEEAAETAFSLLHSVGDLWKRKTERDG